MDQHFSTITQNFLLQSQEAIKSLGKCLETLQEEFLDNNEELQLDQIQLFDRYERFLKNLTLLQSRSELIKNKMINPGGSSSNSRESRISSFKNDLSTLMEDFADLNGQLNDLSADISNAAQHQQQQDTPSSTLSFQPKPLKILSKSNHGSLVGTTMGDDDYSGSDVDAEDKKSPIKKRHSRRRNSNDEMTLPSIFNGRNRISIAIFHQEDTASVTNTQTNNDDETVIYPMLDNDDDMVEEDEVGPGIDAKITFTEELEFGDMTHETILDDQPVLRRYNSHESILSVQKLPLKFQLSNGFSHSQDDTVLTRPKPFANLTGSNAKPLLWNPVAATSATTAAVSSTIVSSTPDVARLSKTLLKSHITQPAVNKSARPTSTTTSFWEQIRNYTVPSVSQVFESNAKPSLSYTPRYNKRENQTRRHVSVNTRNRSRPIYSQPSVETSVQSNLLTEALLTELGK